jgi:hypothetical protein
LTEFAETEMRKFCRNPLREIAEFLVRWRESELTADKVISKRDNRQNHNEDAKQGGNNQNQRTGRANHEPAEH